MSFADYVLFLRALPLSHRAQKVCTTPIPQVVASMSGHGGGGEKYSEDQLALAATRATARWSRWFGGLDTCLVRSLVIGALLEGRGEVVLHIGFRPGDSETMIDGHAWITLNGRPIGADGQQVEESYTRALALSFGKNGGGLS